MGRRTDSGGWRRACGRGRLCLVFAFLFINPARRAVAQGSALERLRLDQLQLTSLGAAYGRIFPSQIEPTNLFAVSADYGEITRSWRVIFGVSYWESRYRDDVVQTFVDTLNRNLENVGGGSRVTASRISLYDVTFSTEARYIPTYSGELKPYLGVGIAAHVINAEGKLVNGTFVERSLDNIAAGIFVATGVSVKLVSHFGLEAGARGDLLSGFRSTQIRAGGAYYFGNVRGTTPPAGGPGTNTNKP